MRKRQLHHLSTKTRAIRPVYFLGIAVVSGVVCVFALRANNQHMIQLRDAVYAADQSNSDVQKPLKELQSYVTTHMNTNLSAGNTAVYPPIQLKHTYERLVKAQNDAIAAANSDVYSAAQRTCEQQNPTDVSGMNRIPCIEAYVQSHTTKTTTVPDSLYKFAFVTPNWSPDLAGWSMVIAVLSTILAIGTFAINKLLKRVSR